MIRLEDVKVIFGSLPRWPAVLVCAAGLAACGNLTAGGFGNTDTYMTADGGQGSSTAPSGKAPAPSASAGPQKASIEILPGGLEGTLAVSATALLVNSDGTGYALTNGAVQANLDLGGAGERKIGHTPVPFGVYDSLRVVFADVFAEVTGGLTIDGVPFKGSVSVDPGSAPLEVSLPLALSLEDGGTAAFLIDLNAAQWVPLLDPLTHVVTAQAFEQAVTATLQ